VEAAPTPPVLRDSVGFWRAWEPGLLHSDSLLGDPICEFFGTSVSDSQGFATQAHESHQNAVLVYQPNNLTVRPAGGARLQRANALLQA
jgi:hypothetical protein